MKSKKKMTTTALAVALAVLLLIGGGTFAYLQSTTGDVKNNFKTNQVTVDLTETTGSDYDIIPGTEQSKDPKVTVNNTVDAYVYVEVTDTTQGLVEYSIADGWTPLDGFEGVYYREVAKSTDPQVFNVLKDDKVSYSTALENSNMLDADGNLKDGIELTFKAHAIQKAGFDDALAAYKQIPMQVGSDKDLKSAIQSGKSILLSKDITISTEQDDYTEYNLAENATLDLNGNTLTVPFLKGIFQGENVTLKNGTVESKASYPLFIGNGTEKTSITVENVNLNGINVFEGSAVLKNVTADASSKQYYAVWADHGATITIESGTFTGGSNSDAVLAAAESEDGPAGSIIIKGGKFNTDVSTYVAYGYHVERDGIWYIVKKND